MKNKVEVLKFLVWFVFQTPGNFEADFNEIIKQEEEESGLKLSCSDEKTPRRVRTSLEEKYAKLSKTSSVAPTSVTQKEGQQNAVEQQQNEMLTVECVVVCTLLNDFVTHTVHVLSGLFDHLQSSSYLFTQFLL